MKNEELAFNPQPSTFNPQPSTHYAALPLVGERGEGLLPFLHPMVEVNLRMTMGMVSILLQRSRPEGFRGVFRLDYFANPEAMKRDNASRQSASAAFRLLAAGPHYRAYVDAQ